MLDPNTLYNDLPLRDSKLDVRIVTINPSRIKAVLPGYIVDPLHCTLESTALSDAQAFDALSYCWGDTTAPKELNVNGLTISVSSNLHQALLHLRHPAIPRRVWIDAICINQESNEEKAAQVSVMADIYATAKLVVA